MQALMYNGIPIYESEYAYETKVVEKKWKRINRPDKVKTRCIKVPILIKSNLFGLGRPVIYAPKEIINTLRKAGM